MPSVAEQLASYAYELRYADLPEETIHEVKRRVVDSLACALGAHEAPPVLVAKKILHPDSAEHAAFLYGTMIRYLDFNDSYISKDIVHPSDNLGGILAAAKFSRSHGREVITATALAYEIQCRLCDAASLRARGWDHVIYGLASSGLAVGKLMELTAKQTEYILGIALTSNVCTRQVREGTELSMWKASDFANACAAVTFYARLAQQGMTGPGEVFEGKYGVWNMLTGKFKLDVKKFGGIKNKFKINDCWIKKWPAEVHAQSAIEAALELRKELRMNQIKKIEIETHEAAKTIIGTGKEKWRPHTKETADHSLPYIVSAAFADGKVWLDTFQLHKFRDARILGLLKKVSVVENKKLTKLYPRAAANRIVVTLSSGKKLEKIVIHQRGHTKNPLTDEELEEKFHALTKSHLSEMERRKLLEFIWNLEKQKNIEPLYKILEAYR